MSNPAAPGGRDADLVYIWVADDIAARIAPGELAPGTRLRPERELAEHYGSIRRAMQVLRERGLIVTRHGRGPSWPARCVTRTHAMPE